MIISELKPQYVFQTLGTGVTVVAIDFQKGAYIDLGNQVVSRIQNMLSNTSIKFYTVTEEA